MSPHWTARERRGRKRTPSMGSISAPMPDAREKRRLRPRKHATINRTSSHAKKKQRPNTRSGVGRCCGGWPNAPTHGSTAIADYWSVSERLRPAISHCSPLPQPRSSGGRSLLFTDNLRVSDRPVRVILKKTARVGRKVPRSACPALIHRCSVTISTTSSLVRRSRCCSAL